MNNVTRVAVIVLILIIAGLAFMLAQDDMETMQDTSVAGEVDTMMEDDGNGMVDSSEEVFLSEKWVQLTLTSPHTSAGTDVLTSPATFVGEIPGTWFFEASFSIRVEDSVGNVIGQGVANATGDWMTEDPVPFTATVEFTVPAGVTEGQVVFEKHNASGLPEHEDYIEIPVQF